MSISIITKIVHPLLPGFANSKNQIASEAEIAVPHTRRAILAGKY
ncbi:hypothetical protein ACO0LD_13230 [Undibacterium sp. Ji83W]